MPREISCGICGGHSVLAVKEYKEILDDGTILVIHDVPCYRCSQCGEEFFLFSTLDRIEKIKKSMMEQGKTREKYAA